MSLVGRAARRIRRDLKKYLRLRQARREGLVYVEPNFIYRPNLSSTSVVIDGGCSYQADFSVYLMQRHDVRAFGVDPTHKHGPALEALQRAHPGRFTYVPCAIAAVDGLVTFSESAVNESGSLLTDHVNVVRDQVTRYDVKALSLGSLLTQIGVDAVDILKLDLEGAEYELLEAVTPEQLQPFRQVFVEFHHHAVDRFQESDTHRLVERLSHCGFRAFSLDDHNYLFYRRQGGGDVPA